MREADVFEMLLDEADMRRDLLQKGVIFWDGQIVPEKVDEQRELFNDWVDVLGSLIMREMDPDLDFVRDAALVIPHEFVMEDKDDGIPIFLN